MTISFCIITLNEEENLGRCLESVHPLADEIIILDSGSTDNTPIIASRFDAKFVVTSWPGYVEQKNRAIALASNDWVFSIDADEVLSPELQEEISRVKQGALENEVAGYSVPRCVFYEGRWIRHGDWFPDRVIRLFRRSQARFAGGKVHERLEVTGEVLPFKGELYHYSFRDKSDHWSRCEKYARLWAESQAERGKRSGSLSPVFHAAFRFIRAYFLRRGFLDGALGLRIAVYSAREVYLKYSLLAQMNRRGKS